MTPSPHPIGPMTMETNLVSPGPPREHGSVVPISVPNQQQISLSLLIEYLIQRVYHELTVLAELLPRKTDMERKIEIFNFASRSRMLFVRLLALVKWASSATKVDKCNQIMAYLERQSQLFTETADSLAQMARETLVRATLPNFHLPAAVEVLTLGQYTRVPRCVRERIVPSEPITAQEKRITLLRINQVIEQRLVSSQLPLQMRNLKIENGYVTFTVANEFEASLTLTGDGPAVPWRLLRLKVLVQDKETGEGKALVHRMQVGYMEQLVQSRLVDNPRPLHDLYNVLHSLCQSLQLEVLYSQTTKLIFERLGEYIRIEEYKPGQCLTISYWRELLSQREKKDASSELGYRFSVQTDLSDSSSPLKVVHVPPLSAEDAEIAEKSIRSENLSMERLLVHTIYFRTRARLSKLSQDIHKSLDLGDVEANLHGSPAVLSIPILQPCLRSEQLLITIDTHTGILQSHVPQYEDNPFTGEIQATLNDDQSRLVQLVTHLRYWITKQRVRKTLQQLPATPFERLPILYDQTKHPLKDLGPNRMYIRFHRQPNAILIVEFNEKENSRCEIDYRYHLLWVRPASIEDDPKDESMTSDIPRVYLKALSLVEFDPFLVTHATSTKVDVQDLSERLTGKRKIGGKVEAPIKRTRYPAYFISDLAHVVAFTDERIPFTCLAAELTKKEIAHSGVEIEEKSIGLIIKLISFPKVEGVDQSVIERLQCYLLSASVRMQSRGSRGWKAEFVFFGNPVGKIQNSRHGGRSTVYLTQENAAGDCSPPEFVDLLVQEWYRFVHLFMLVDTSEDYLSDESIGLSNILGIKSFTFKDLILEYGPEHKQTVKVAWDAPAGRFSLIFGGDGEYAGMNPHCMMREQFENHLNTKKNLPLLGKILHETYSPLKSLAQLPTIPQLSLLFLRTQSPIQTFSIVPQSETRVKVMFYNQFCLDINFRAGSVVLVRDAAISSFDQRKVVEDLQPIAWLKAFLMRYVDETALLRRHSQTEDDNPPSPVAIGGQGSSDDLSSTSGLRFPTPHTPPSNPLTPASPLTSAGPGSQQPIPSPGFTAPSPANPVSSVGSPFPSVQSPLAVGSPGLNRPSPRPGLSPQPGSVQSLHGASLHHDKSFPSASRVLPQRLWAGANPTPLTHKAFDEICRPSAVQPPLPNTAVPTNMNLAPIHRFLGCVFLRRCLQQSIKSDEHLTLVPSAEPGTVLFRVEGLLCKVASYAANAHQTLHLKVEPDNAYAHHWSSEMIMILEKFFDTRIAAPPYRANHLLTFIRIIQCPLDQLKDILALIRFDICPEMIAKANLKWAPRLCLTSTPAAPPIMPLGQPGFFRIQDKILIFIQLTRANVNLPPGTDPYSVVIPVVHDVKTNQTSVAQKETNTVTLTVQQRLAHLARSGQLNMQRCTILPSLQELMTNLSLPNEGPPHQPLPVSSSMGIMGTNTSVTPGSFPSSGSNMGTGAMGPGAINPNLMSASPMNTGPMGPGPMNTGAMGMNPGMQQQQMRPVGPGNMMGQRMGMGMNPQQNFMGQ